MQYYGAILTSAPTDPPLAAQTLVNTCVKALGDETHADIRRNGAFLAGFLCDLYGRESMAMLRILTVDQLLRHGDIQQ